MEVKKCQVCNSDLTELMQSIEEGSDTYSNAWMPPMLKIKPYWCHNCKTLFLAVEIKSGEVSEAVPLLSHG